MTEEQLPLDLGRRPALGRDAFLVSGSNAAALAMIESWQTWPEGKLALVGPEGAGKTHLVHVWAELSGARIVRPDRLEDLPAERLIAVEDVDRIASLPAAAQNAAEEALFHLHNATLSAGGHLLITGRVPPAKMQIGLPDLASRLSVAPVAELNAPDDQLLAGVLVKLFADRQIRVGSHIIRYLVRRIERSIPAAERIVAALDKAALREAKSINRTLVARIMDAHT